jgi:hypothetical protein
MIFSGLVGHGVAGTRLAAVARCAAALAAGRAAVAGALARVAAAAPPATGAAGLDCGELAGCAAAANTARLRTAASACGARRRKERQRGMQVSVVMACEIEPDGTCARNPHKCAPQGSAVVHSK